MEISARTRMSLRTIAAVGLLCSLVLVTSVHPAAAKTKIILWHSGDAIYRQLVEDFNRTHDTFEVELQVESTEGSMSTISDKVAVAVAAGVPPDVVRFNRPYASEWAAKGLLIALDPYLAQFGIKRDQFIPFAWDEGTYAGSVYVLPEETDARAVFYNKGMLSEAGYDTNSLPERLDDFDAMALKLNVISADGRYTRYGFLPWSSQGGYLFSWTPSFNGQLYDAASDTITVNHPNNVRIFEWMLGYHARYGGKVSGSFNSGKAALNVNTNTGRVSLDKISGLEWGVTYMPAPDYGQRRATYAGGFGIAMPIGTKHPREGAEFIAWWVSDETQLQRAKARGNFPATIRATRDPVFTRDPYQSVFINGLANAQARPTIPILGDLWDGIKLATNRVLKEMEPPRSVLDDITRRMQARLKEARSIK